MTRDLLCAAILLVALIAVRFAHSQDKPKETPKPPAPLTEKEKLDFRSAQVELLQSLDAVKTSDPWKAYQAETDRVNKIGADIFTSRHLNPESGEYVLCDGPGNPRPIPACVGLAKGDLELKATRPVEPKAEKPAETKK
jgi:hypothetical protein